MKRLTPDDSLGHLLNHPAFAGFARLLLPWDDRRYDDTMPLQRVGSLLPYHTHVNPAAIVATLNRLIDDVSAGKAVYYDIYSEAQKRADPTRRHAGVFFLRGIPGAPFALIAPGGGFAYVASVHEGFPYAVEINKRGYNAFVVKYRAGLGGTAAIEDMAAALSCILRNAGTLGVAPCGYSLWGSSAGARVAASIGSYGTVRFGGSIQAKPSALILLYTGHSDLTASEPPTFVAVGDGDGIAPPAAVERRVAALRRQGTEVEYRKYPGVAHGFGLGSGTSAAGWMADAVQFWERQLQSTASRTSGRETCSV